MNAENIENTLASLTVGNKVKFQDHFVCHYFYYTNELNSFNITTETANIILHQRMNNVKKLFNFHLKQFCLIEKLDPRH